MFSTILKSLFIAKNRSCDRKMFERDSFDNEFKIYVTALNKARNSASANYNEKTINLNQVEHWFLCLLHSSIEYYRLYIKFLRDHPTVGKIGVSIDISLEFYLFVSI